MESKTKRHMMWGMAIAGVAASAAYGLMVRPWHREWGAEPIDVKRPMPGDQIVDEPDEVTNRAVIIEASPGDIWPWLVCTSHRHGGLHSDKVSADFDPASKPLQYQHLSEGDQISADKGRDLRVEAVDPERWLVMVPEERSYGTASWAIALMPFAANRTRVLCRSRLSYGWSPRGLYRRVTQDPASFLLTRQWLHTLKARAEQTARERQRNEHMLRPPYSYQWRPRQRPRGELRL